MKIEQCTMDMDMDTMLYGKLYTGGFVVNKHICFKPHQAPNNNGGSSELENPELLEIPVSGTPERSSVSRVFILEVSWP